MFPGRIHPPGSVCLRHLGEELSKLVLDFWHDRGDTEAAFISAERYYFYLVACQIPMLFQPDELPWQSQQFLLGVVL